jgi:hypothetical protein
MNYRTYLDNLRIYIIIIFIITTSVYLLQSATAQINLNNPVVPNTISTGNTTGFSNPITNSKTTFIPIDINQNHSFVVWESNITGNSEIMFAKHTNGGVGFSGKINLSNSPDAESVNPSLKVDGNNIYVTWWEKYHNGLQAPMYIQSTDNGTKFGGPTILSLLK